MSFVPINGFLLVSTVLHRKVAGSVPDTALPFIPVSQEIGSYPLTLCPVSEVTPCALPVERKHGKLRALNDIRDTVRT